LKILIGCEFSGRVRDAFAKLGHEAYSCDLEPSETPGNHIQGDLLAILNDGFDLAIFDPPCTYLTNTGNKWFYHPEDSHLPVDQRRPHPRFPTRQQDRKDGIAFFMALANAPIHRICVENPIGIMSRIYRKPDQIIQPYWFGEEFQKSTCLWLKNLPLLVPTKMVGKGEMITYKSGNVMSKWYAEARSLPDEERRKLRNRTFQGIADAMANLWGDGQKLADYDNAVNSLDKFFI